MSVETTSPEREKTDIEKTTEKAMDTVRQRFPAAGLVSNGIAYYVVKDKMKGREWQERLGLQSLYPDQAWISARNHVWNL